MLFAVYLNISKQFTAKVIELHILAHVTMFIWGHVNPFIGKLIINIFEINVILIVCEDREIMCFRKWLMYVLSIGSVRGVSNKVYF